MKGNEIESNSHHEIFFSIVGERLSPNSPSWDADALNDADTDLSHEHKEEHHKVEGAVTPEEKKNKKTVTQGTLTLNQGNLSSVRLDLTPNSSVRDDWIARVTL